MVGSSLLTLPWAFAHSGLLLGVLVALLCGLSSMHTCVLVVQDGGPDPDYGDTVGRWLGARAKQLHLASSVLVMLGVNVGYYQLLTQCLYPPLQGVANLLRPAAMATPAYPDIYRVALDEFSLAWVCLPVSLGLFFLFAQRDFSCFLKLNSLGVLSVLFVLLTTAGYALYAFATTAFTISLSPSPSLSQPAPQHVSLFAWDFGKLAGLLGSGFLIHNFILPILRHSTSTSAQHRTRAVRLGFGLVFLSYAGVGVLGYFAFSGSAFRSSPAPLSATQVSLNMFAPTHPLAFLLRAVSAFQTLSVLPLAFSLMRSQTFALCGLPLDSRCAFWLFNCALLLTATLLGIFFPNVGSIMAWVGAFCGFALIYLLPVAVRLRKQHLLHSFHLSTYAQPLLADPSTSTSSGGCYICSVCFNLAVLGVGAAVFVLQFVPAPARGLS